MVKRFLKYVAQSVAGMLGFSVYILADTFFISKSAGADGLTVLNLELPVYGLIYAIGSMIGIGSATRYAIKKAQGEKEIDYYFMQSLFWCAVISIPFILLGLFMPEQMLRFMGADKDIAELGKDYLRIILFGAPLFMMDFTFTAFVRNDNAPAIAMIGALFGSMFNIVFDYILMFPMGLGLTGAALATAISPMVTMLICGVHYLGKHNHVGFGWKLPSVKHLLSCCQFGVAAFVGEISSAITTIAFNTLILGIAGNTGIAAYGVIANISLVAMSIFNGISQGTQPLISSAYGSGKRKDTGTLLKASLVVTLAVQAMIIIGIWGCTDWLIGVFNSEGNDMLLLYAHNGMRLYFFGYLVAGVNIMLAGYFSATDRAAKAFVASVLRGAFAIVGCAILMSKIWGLNGVWLSFPAAEAITFLVVLAMGGLFDKEGRRE